ncbi:MAG: CCA tRNA nucleotidyltransferase [Lentisphaerae bacterium]|nr:CCA tRNA nucleotidyltransferase [Lentisphaerota bacterium]
MLKNFHFFSGSAAFRSAKKAVEQLRRAGYLAYFAGGAVRDLLMGRAPADIDIATSATPEQIHEVFPKTHDSGVSFGVVTIHIDGFLFETATFRKECAYSDGRHPGQTIYTVSPQEDVARRDFTINGMMLDPVNGEILDFVGGLEDLKRGIIRTIGNGEERFREDALRILRAVRFHARYNFPMASETEDAARKLVGNLRVLSAERIKTELEEMLTGPNPELAFRTLERIGALEIVLPEIAAMKGVEQQPEFHPEGDVFEHTMIMLRMMAHPTPETAWSVLFHDVGKPETYRLHEDGKIHFYGHEAVGAKMAEQIMQRLRSSRELTDIVSAAVRNHMRFTAAHNMRRNTLRRLISEKSFPATLEVIRMDCASCHCIMTDYLYLLDFLHELNGEPAVPPPLLTGKDMIDLGYKPGPGMGKILKKISDLQLDGVLTSREDAIKYLISEKGS